jgi:hypothetical protein
MFDAEILTLVCLLLLVQFIDRKVPYAPLNEYCVTIVTVSNLSYDVLKRDRPSYPLEP